MDKKISWDAIPKFTKTANYAIDVSWSYLEYTLKSWEGYGNLDLDPDFQREHVWDEVKQIRYVEYILKGGKSSRDIFFNQPYWPSVKLSHRLELVDGKQRLEAVRKFLRNDLPIFGGYKITDFDGRPSISDASFKFHVNDLPQRKMVLQWYLDLNDGGVVHTDEELNKVRQMLFEEVNKK